MTLPRLGAHVEGTRTRFALFATSVERCRVRIFGAGGSEETYDLVALGDGYFATEVEGVGHGARYKFLLDEREFPDPYARFLPDGVHGAAMVVAPGRRAEPKRTEPPLPLSRQVFYELHVGAFTQEGTFDAAARRLPHLVELGVTTVELLPISSFPGQRGWGYDGVAQYAPFAPYGDPDSLRRFVDRAHELGLLVILDVVYNHFGPSGNFLGAFSPRYFTDEYRNAWGCAPRFDDVPMRRYVIDNALYWILEFQFDGLRLDATHAIFDSSEVHILRELADAVRAEAPHALLIAEDERNDPACVNQLGCDAIWADDFHHQVRVTLTGESDGYYRGYTPGARDLARTIERGWLYEGQTSLPSSHPRGHRADMLAAESFVYCIQNHDQIGNRAHGTRLCHDIDIDAYCLASTLLLFLPMTPLIFMGQEWAASTPFLFFTDHDPALGALVTAGRRREFAAFSAFANEAAQRTIPDPQARETFERSKLAWSEIGREPHTRVLALYKELLAMRRRDPVLLGPQLRRHLSAMASGELLAVRRTHPDLPDARLLLANFGRAEIRIADVPWTRNAGRILFSLGTLEHGTLAPRGAVILESRAP
jgi:maltooligosyltrehalose trehalohydrolase